MVDFLTQETGGNFDLKLTGYTATAISGEHKWFFSDVLMKKDAFYFHNKIKKDIGGEIRDYSKKDIQYYDFSGLYDNPFKWQPVGLKCVDINSAYLSALLREKIITEKTFKFIDTRSRRSKEAKMSRLKAVGMFAADPVIFIYRSGQPERIDPQGPGAFAWVFYHACKVIQDVMQEIKKDDLLFLFYWVDGYFTGADPEFIQKKINSLGFDSKIEKITDFQVYEKNIHYLKDGEPKILFLPGEEKRINFKPKSYITL